MTSHIEIEAELCKSCGFCIDACRRACIGPGQTVNSKGYSVVEAAADGACNGCKLCAVMCPEAAITVYVSETV